jgi:hypothetical protein
MATVGFQQIRISIDFDWTLETGTWTTVPIDEILLDSTDVLPNPTVLESEMADNSFLIDAYEWSGNIRHLIGAAGIPAVNTPFWIELTPFAGSAIFIGGPNGITGSVAETGARSIRDGRPYLDLMYTIIAAAYADIAKDV